MTVLGLLPEGFILYIVCKSCIYRIIRGEFVIGAYAPDFDRLVSAEMQRKRAITDESRRTPI
jgi:hypothetical protein